MGNGDSRARREIPWQQLLAEFAPIPSLHRQVGCEARPPALQAMMGHPAYVLMEGLLADLNIVYSPPKVGSTTISATLSRHPSIGSELPHIHFLSSTGLAFLEQQLQKVSSHPNAHLWRSHLTLCRWLRVLLAANRALQARGGPATVRKPFLLAGVREPIAQYLSFLFEVWWMYADTPEAITADFVRARMADDPWFPQCHAWFTNDLGEMFEVDVYARPFPTDRGWDIYENDVARVLLIRQESFDRLPDALGALYGFDPATIEVETANTAARKPYSARYAAVKKVLRLAERELTEVYGLPYVRHFYTPEEIEVFKGRWRAGGDSCPPHRSERIGEPGQPLLAGQQHASHVVAKASGQGDREPPEAFPFPRSQSTTQHSHACHPCQYCTQQLQVIRGLQTAYTECLASIQRLPTHRSVTLRLLQAARAKCRGLLRRLGRRGRAA